MNESFQVAHINEQGSGAPRPFEVLFASNLAWTPLLLFPMIGLFLFCWREPRIGAPLLSAFLAFYLFIACYPDWAGISSYGNRFFISLTPLFILGLAVFFDRAAQLFRSQRTSLAATIVLLAVTTLWNVGLMFQWGAHLISARGQPILRRTPSALRRPPALPLEAQSPYAAD